MRLAWIESAAIRDIALGNPADLYHPEIAAFYTVPVPEGAEIGDGWVAGNLVKPEAVTPPDPVASVVAPPKVSPVEFMLLFTSQERVAIKAARSSDPIIDDFLDVIEDPRLTVVDLGLGSTVSAINYMVYAGKLAAERKAKILTGVML